MEHSSTARFAALTTGPEQRYAKTWVRSSSSVIKPMVRMAVHLSHIPHDDDAPCAAASSGCGRLMNENEQQQSDKRPPLSCNILKNGTPQHQWGKESRHPQGPRHVLGGG